MKAETVSQNNRSQVQIFLMFCLVAASMADMSHAKTLNVCYDQWPPMTMFPSQESSARGVVIDMLEEIYSSKGYELQYFEVPLARGLDMVAEGLCDMLPEYLYSGKSESGFEYADEPTFAYTSAFVVRREDPWRYDGVQSIEGRRIATGPGWDYSSMSESYQSYINDPKNTDFVEVVAGYDDVVDRIFRMIEMKRIDSYADNELVLQHVLNRLKLHAELKIVRPGLENKLIEMPIFSKKIPAEKRQELIRTWNEGRLSFKGEKEERLLRKYGIKFEERRPDDSR